MLETEPSARLDGAELLRLIRSAIEAGEAELIAFRRRLHAEPELSFREFGTTEWVMERLYVAGLKPVRLASGTGLYCDIGVGRPGVVLRADLDALAMQEASEAPFRSRTDGVAHACGHDVHTTVVLGAGLVLNRLARAGRLPGAVRLIFEPGEEAVPGGGLEIVSSGLLDGAEAVFAVHCDPKLDVGHVGLRSGPITSASDMVEVSVSGPGGHTARPGLTVNLIDVLSRLAVDLPPLLTEAVAGHGAVRLVFGSIGAGDAPNVIPSRGYLRGSLRTPDRHTWGVLPAALRECVGRILDPTGAVWELNHVRGVSPVRNDEAETALVASAAAQLLGPDRVHGAEHSWGGDSFGWFTDVLPGSYIRLGTHNPAWASHHDLHHPAFEVDERSIAHGAALLAYVAALRSAGEQPREELG